MEMSLSLSADQQSEIEQGRLLTAVVGSSQLHCVVVRADLIEQYQYLSDASPDSGIQEATKANVATDSADGKSPSDWQGAAGKSTPRTLVAFLAIWAVAASVLVVITASHLSLTQRKLAQAEIDRHDEMTATIHRLLMDFQGERCKGASIHAFHRWLPLARRSENEDGAIDYSWSTKTSNIEGPGFCVITTNRDGCVLTAVAGFPDW